MYSDTYYAAISVSYLAMMAEFGYIVALMRSGLMLREHFFMPNAFHPALPLRSQMLLGSSVPATEPAGGEQNLELGHIRRRFAKPNRDSR